MVLSIGHGHQLVAKLGRPPLGRTQRTVLILALSTNPRHHVEANAPEGSYVVRSPTSDIGTKR